MYGESLDSMYSSFISRPLPFDMAGKNRGLRPSYKGQASALPKELQVAPESG